MYSFVLYFSLLHHVYYAQAAVPNQSDYVIVGAGTVGCALASRLCDRIPSARIILVERSLPRDREAEFLVRSPRNFFNAFNSTKVSEIFSDIPSQGLANRSARVSTGNTLGGSSSTNGMQWFEPVQGTLEKWGIKGLTTASSKKFFRKAFNSIGFRRPSRHRSSLYVRDHLRAAIKSGYPENNDPFDTQSRKSIFENLLAVDEMGFRIDSCTAYLRPAQRKKCSKNLRIIQGAVVTQVLFKKSRGKLIATGVEYVHPTDHLLKRKMKIHAQREVILSAGPIGSPKLLQLSGIGPRDVLQKAGVRVKVSLPVGVKTQARPAVSIFSSYSVPLEPSNNSTLLKSPASRMRWERGQGGVLAISPLVLNGRDQLDGYLSATASNPDGTLDKPYLSTTCLINPESYGYLRIKDNNPFSEPDVQFALLSKEMDIVRAESCANRILLIHKSFPTNFKLAFVDPPNGIVTRQWIRRSSFWSGHYVGGCPVGPVLRSDLRVRRTSRLRVIDASSMPTVPVSAGPMATAYMLAEFFAEKIETEWYSELKAQRYQIPR